jgi:hypothetical protein
LARLRSKLCHRNATIRSLCIVIKLHLHCQQGKTVECCRKTQELGPLHCCRATKYFVLLTKIQTYSGLHARCPILLSDFNQIWSLSKDFRRSRQYEISRKFVRWEPHWNIRNDRQTDGHDEANSRFAIYATTPKNNIERGLCVCVCVRIYIHIYTYIYKWAGIA